MALAIDPASAGKTHLETWRSINNLEKLGYTSALKTKWVDCLYDVSRELQPQAEPVDVIIDVAFKICQFQREQFHDEVSAENPGLMYPDVERLVDVSANALRLDLRAEIMALRAGAFFPIEQKKLPVKK